MTGVISDEARAWIGRTVADNIVEVSRADIRKYSFATGLRSGIHVDRGAAVRAGFRDVVAPSGFHHAVMSMAKMLVPTCQLERDGVPPGILPPVPLTRAMAGGSEVWYNSDIVAGDEVHVTERIQDIYSKRGRSGDLVFVIFSAELNVGGVDAVVERTTRIMW